MTELERPVLVGEYVEIRYGAQGLASVKVIRTAPPDPLAKEHARDNARKIKTGPLVV
jgi:hypothetical protein